MSSVAIIGIGCRPFGRYLDTTARKEAVRAVRAALDDAAMSWGDIDYAVGGSMDAGSADTLVADLGLTGVPFVNVLNGCATGTSSLVAAVQAIGSGAAETALVVGFDSHPRGAFAIRPEALGLGQWYGTTGLAMTSQFFALKIQRYLHEHGLPARLLETVASKAFRNAALNPNAWRRKPLTEADVRDSMMLSDPLRQYMFCSPGDGAAALVLCSAERAKRYRDDPVYIAGAAVRTHAARIFRGAQSVAVGAPRCQPECGRRCGRLRGRRYRARRSGPGSAAGHRRRGGAHPPGRDRAVRTRRADRPH